MIEERRTNKRRDGYRPNALLSPSVAIPALQPIVHDLFVLRGCNKADAGKELDTQKEVVVSMLLRLIQYHQVHTHFLYPVINFIVHDM